MHRSVPFDELSVTGPVNDYDLGLPLLRAASLILAPTLIPGHDPKWSRVYPYLDVLPTRYYLTVSTGVAAVYSFPPDGCTPGLTHSFASLPLRLAV